MKLLVLWAGCAALAGAQSTTTTYTADYANGGFAVSSVSSSSDHTQTQAGQSLNGGQVPLEKHEEHVIRSDANGSVTEAVVKHYDPTGQLVSTDRTVTEVRKSGNGSTSQSTAYHTDVNGQEQVTERNTTETSTSGSTTTVNTTVDRPSPGGTFEAVEKRSEVTQTETQGKEKKSTTTESVYRGDPSEGFHEAERKVITATNTDGRTVTDTTDYGPGSTNGELQFQERRLSTTSIAPNGDQSTIVDVYAPSADGTVRDPNAAPQIKQEQIISRVKNPDGSVVDTFSIREPSVSDPTHLGDVRPISRTVCTGKCSGAPAASPAADSAATPAAPAAPAK